MQKDIFIFQETKAGEPKTMFIRSEMLTQIYSFINFYSVQFLREKTNDTPYGQL